MTVFYADKTTPPLRAMIMCAHERRSLFFISGAAESGILRFVRRILSRSAGLQLIEIICPLFYAVSVCVCRLRDFGQPQCGVGTDFASLLAATY